ncbi:hypothetical protein Celaphus_00011582 [Cervus elaphus hippelaphus]|uniref:Uncharacterized protein n=1 Tax=Cervus elaphus hippelaphus TaxID=46360 RepID=A0A212DF24_CEREH|nr:hypothetical protein Celaphus_00011582 [Cervus elaphus hippelaphus]
MYYLRIVKQIVICIQVKDQLNQLLLQQNFLNGYPLKYTCWYLVWLNRKIVIK